MNTTNDNFETHIEIQQNSTSVIEHLAHNTQLSKGELKRCLQKGSVWLTHNQHTQRVRKAKKILATGDNLHLYYNPSILSQNPLPATLIASEQDYSIWYKPYGMYCQGSKWGDHCTINRWVEQHTQQPVFIVHRLDRATTGLIIIAHKKSAASALSGLFAERKINKKYRAIVKGQYPATQSTLSINSDIEGRNAISHFKTINVDAAHNQSLVDVTIETGRKHQIRRHLAEQGYPIVGDRLYGSADDDINLQLCCYHLEFTCPLSSQEKRYNLDQSLQPQYSLP
jgi:tRNA pseudouridine32 synthase/23S rRNA pseudouridine746 synthase